MKKILFIALLFLITSCSSHEKTISNVIKSQLHSPETFAMHSCKLIENKEGHVKTYLVNYGYKDQFGIAQRKEIEVVMFGDKIFTIDGDGLEIYQNRLQKEELLKDIFRR